MQSDLGDTLLQCFLGYNFQGGRLPMLTFLQRLYAKQKAANIALQRQVCWCLGMVVEAQLLSEKQNSPRTAGLRSTSVQELSDELWSFNYWEAGQKAAKLHLHMPWSCSFDGTRVGGHHVLACMLAFPINVATWAPVQVCR